MKSTLRIPLSLIVFTAVFPIATPLLAAGQREAGFTLPGVEAETRVTAAWKSAYFTEGRDNLDGDSLAAISADLVLGALATGLWVAESPDSSYRELNLFARYEFSLGPVQAYVGYTHLTLMTDDLEDNEVGGGLSWDGLPGEIVVGFDGYHSFDARGAFFETWIKRDFQPTGTLVLTPYGVLGWNEGYIAEGHDGANHVVTGLRATLALTEQLELSAHLAHSWRINADDSRFADDASLKDLLHGGVALTWSF